MKRQCMICGGVTGVLRQGDICLCGRCITALSGALGPKLPGFQPESTQKSEKKPAFSKAVS